MTCKFIVSAGGVFNESRFVIRVNKCHTCVDLQLHVSLCQIQSTMWIWGILKTDTWKSRVRTKRVRCNVIQGFQNSFAVCMIKNVWHVLSLIVGVSRYILEKFTTQKMSDTAQTASIVFINGEPEVDMAVSHNPSTDTSEDTTSVSTTPNYTKTVDRNNIAKALTRRTMGSPLDKHEAWGNEGDDCVVCMEPMMTEDEVVDFRPCKHTYNSSAISPYCLVTCSTWSYPVLTLRFPKQVPHQVCYAVVGKQNGRSAASLLSGVQRRNISSQLGTTCLCSSSVT